VGGGRADAPHGSVVRGAAKSSRLSLARPSVELRCWCRRAVPVRTSSRSLRSHAGFLGNVTANRWLPAEALRGKRCARFWGAHHLGAVMPSPKNSRFRWAVPLTHPTGPKARKRADRGGRGGRGQANERPGAVGTPSRRWLERQVCTTGSVFDPRKKARCTAVIWGVRRRVVDDFLDGNGSRYGK